MLLTDDEILNSAASTLGEMHVENCGLGDIKDFARALEAAILAKLASSELPEPETKQMLEIGTKFSSENWGERSFNEIDFYSAACEIFKLGQSQAYAQGAASQLAQEPDGFLSQHNLEMLKQGYPQTIVMMEGAKRDVPLFTLKEPK